MLERDVRRKYQLEMGVTLVVYMVVLIGALKFGKPMQPGALRTTLLLAPIIPIGFFILVIARQFGRMDEFVRKRSLEGLAIAAAVTAALSLTCGFLEGADFPRLSTCGTPLSFKYELATARIYVTIGSLDHPESVTLVKQFGIESRLPWVKFCEDVPAERTGASAAAQEYLATMRTNQRGD